MTNIIFGYDNWVSEYRNSKKFRKSIWIYAKLNNDQDVYLSQYEYWQDLKNLIKDKNYKVVEIGLKYKSNLITVDATNSDGVYVVRSVKGEFGGSTKQCYTIGIVRDNNVHKTMWLVPELIEESSFIDDVDNCFEEAMITYGTKTQTL